MTVRPHPIALGSNVLYALPLADGGLLLVDAGPDLQPPDGDSWELARLQAWAHGFAPADVRVVLVTHAHLDHAGLTRRWAEAGARVLAGPADLPAIVDAGDHAQATRAARREELRRHGCPPQVLDLRDARPSPYRWEAAPADAVAPVRDGEAFALRDGATLRVIAAPGHTPGNLVAFVSDEGEGAGDLYSGDTLLPDTIPTPGLHFPHGPDAPRWPSLPPFLDSVRRLRALPLARVWPGHGAPVERPKRLFERFEAHHARRARRIRALLAERPDNAFGLAHRLFPRLPAERIPQAMTETIGHLDVLLAAGKVVCGDEDGGLIFELVTD